MPLRHHATLAVILAMASGACSYPGFAFQPQSDASSIDTGDTDRTEAAAETSLPDVAPDSGPDVTPAPCEADLCDDFERGSLSSSWEGVEATGGALSVVEGGYLSRFALSAKKAMPAGASHIMTKAVTTGATGYRFTFAARIDRAPSDPGQGAFVAIGNAKGTLPFGVALFPQPGGAANADLFAFEGSRARLGVVPVGVWVRFRVELTCTTMCIASAQLEEKPRGEVNVIADPANAEIAVQFGLNTGTGGGDWATSVDDIVLTWTR